MNPGVRSPKIPLVAQTTCPLFAEAPVWNAIGPGWRPLFGSYQNLGFSFEWHDFAAKEEFEWARTFHPGSVEICLNIDGRGKMTDGKQTVDVLPQTFAFYFQGRPSLSATRAAGELHRFITIEFSPAFLAEHFRRQIDNLHPGAFLNQ